MTAQEAIRLIKNLPSMCPFVDATGGRVPERPYYEAVEMAVEALIENGKSCDGCVFNGTTSGYCRVCVRRAKDRHQTKEDA